jgi:predicted transcriptional regulator
MKSSGVKELPILDEARICLGIITEKEVLGDLGAVQIKDVIPQKIAQSLHQDDSCLEGLRLLQNSGFSILPISDLDGLFVGIAQKTALMEQVARSFNFEVPGSVLLILIEQRDFILHQVVRIIEQEQVHVLGCGTSTVEDEPSLVRVSIKLNQYDTGKVQAALRRHGYVVESVSDRVFEQDLLEKADEFLHFLNL